MDGDGFDFNELDNFVDEGFFSFFVGGVAGCAMSYWASGYL